jgi:hypothetical protein
MKLKLTTVLILLISFSAVAQKNSGSKKGQLFGVHYNMADFNSPAGIKDASTGKGYNNIRSMNKGFSISYWRGLTSKIDLSVKANAIFRDYASIYRGVIGKNEIGIELEPAVNIRPFDESAKLAPFLTTGVGVGLYNDKIGGYIPAGGGIQLNFDNLTYLFVQAQYKFTLTEKVLGDNLFYSIGFAQKF